MHYNTRVSIIISLQAAKMTGQASERRRDNYVIRPRVRERERDTQKELENGKRFYWSSRESPQFKAVTIA
jgi:hypothetical protein